MQKAPLGVGLIIGAWGSPNSEGFSNSTKGSKRSEEEAALFHPAKDKAAMFYGALAQVTPSLEPHDEEGFVIITAASDQGMVDIHDRRPLVLAPEFAREWVDATTDPVRAEEIASNQGMAAPHAHWPLITSECCK